MRYLQLVALTLCSLTTTAQPYFQNVYAAGAGGKISLVELTNGNVLTILSNSELVNESGTSILDPSGSVSYSRCYEIDTFLVLQSVKKVSSNDLRFVGGYYKNICPSGGVRIYPSVGKMDSLGNKSNIMYYELNGGSCTNLLGDLTITSNNEALLWGRDNKFFVIRVAHDLSPLWARRFLRNGGFKFVKELPDGDLIAGFDTDTAGASIVRLDANGGVLWCKSYLRPLGTFHDAVIAPDGSITCIGFTRTTPNRLFMLKIDGSGNVVWCRGYESVLNGWAPGSMQIEKTLDNNYVILSTIQHSGSSFLNKPLLLKTDLNGDTLWSRTLGSTDYNYYTADLLVASDGSFWFSGGIEGDLPDLQTGLPQIVKADPQGHFSCQEQPHAMQIVDLFPVDSSFALTSVDGVVAYPAYVNDTASDPITTYDACVITSIPSFRFARKPVLRPNPNNGRFLVEFADPLMAESYYSLFDTMGKLLLQRPLPTGATLEEVDLSRFGASSYVIKFTSPDGVCYERVVVE